MGHVVPGYQKALTLGLDGLKAEVNAKLAAKPDADKQAFYRGVLVALEGISEHCLAYARLACITAARLPEGMAAEKHNLHQVAARMQKLASAAPDTLVEATQLIFTLHAALHLSGEPTAIGRLDQLLQPYYAADLAAGRLDEAGAQEIIDCFWLKIGEKVQSNRLFVEDHQPFGNLAMGGSSGNYPQGAGNNQWVQQVTIGGTIADDSPGAGLPAYNDVTRAVPARRAPAAAERALPVAARASGHSARTAGRSRAWRFSPAARTRFCSTTPPSSTACIAAVTAWAMALRSASAPKAAGAATWR